MLCKCARKWGALRLTHGTRYCLLDHKKMEAVKQKLFGQRQKTTRLKLKFIWKEAKYTIVQGSKDLWADAQWITALYRRKQAEYFTGFELFQSSRIKVDLLKFIPYSIILVVPLAELSLPIILWLFPNAVPSHYLFDTAADARVKQCELIQEQSHRFLIEKLVSTMMTRFNLSAAEFCREEFFKEDYFEIIDQLDQHLDFNRFNSDELIRVLQFMGGGEFVTGTESINKMVNLFTLNIPRLLYKVLRWSWSKITRKDLAPYQDPWCIRGNFRIARFNYFPFEGLKRKFLIWQINRKFRRLWLEDRAFEIYGLGDVVGKNIKHIARERGLAALSCYQTLGNVVKNDWVKFTTHPKFQNNNAKLWYSVMMYSFMKESSREIN